MAFLIPCPNCGSRPYTEFWFGGELVPHASVADPASDPKADVARIWYRRNVSGPQTERWFHYAGCRRWLTAERDTSTNLAHVVDHL